VHGALGVMRGVSRSDAHAARLPTSGHCQGREPFRTKARRPHAHAPSTGVQCPAV